VWTIFFGFSSGISKKTSVKMLLFLLMLLATCDGFLRHAALQSRAQSSWQNNMFSGIIEEMGTVEALQVKNDLVLWDGSVGDGVVLTIRGEKALEEAYIGCSIAVNGVCLTATEITEKTFSVGLAPETLRRSNLDKLQKGSKVNLERALKTNSRNSGHFVQGHVDCTGKIIDKWREGESLWVKVMLPREYMNYIVPKGFVAIDGTSLTICDVNTKENWFTFMLISHTQQSVIIPQKAVGDLVNIEVDVLAKLVESSLDSLKQSLVNDYVSKDEYNKTIAALLSRIEKLEKK
jgi:riboflavin synthase